uniref:Uncharacterized protein n=1 Tax=Anguilla anguilla TaxID=7936 RepID=A0A0E9SQ93_ANGAN
MEHPADTPGFEEISLAWKCQRTIKADPYTHCTRFSLLAPRTSNDLPREICAFLCELT